MRWAGHVARIEVINSCDILVGGTVLHGVSCERVSHFNFSETTCYVNYDGQRLFREKHVMYTAIVELELLL
jgi:hypothetical protein